jgi:diguanylate cyclase (GGDEF) domain
LKEKIRLYFPLKGKQGVYGVLEIVAGNIFRIPEEDIRFIILLTQTAGNAIENVQLYRQSKKSVENLRLLSRIARKLNGGLRLSELVPYVCGEIKRTFQADEAGLFLFREGKPVPLEGSTAFFESAEKDFLHVMKRIANEGESVFTGNFSNEELAKPLPYRSVMMVPLREEKKSMGFIVCLKEHIYAFSLDAFKLFQAIAHHTSLALSNALLREKLEWMVNTDDLTKLNTRSYFDEKLRLSMERDSCGSLLLIDIDDFKMINDTYGHHIGDEVLIQIASLIRETVSSEDVCARWGGEEMVIYLANRSLEEGLELANRIIRLAENQTRPRVTLSCGVSCWHKGIKDSPLALFKRADNALYLAKKRGKNQAVANF